MSGAAAQKAIMAVVAQIVADFTEYPLAVEAPGRDLIDQAEQETPYLRVEIDDLNGEQADMADRPLVRQTGQIVLSVVSKCGTGLLKSQELRDFIVPYFDMKYLDPVHTHAAVLHRGKEFKGWEYLPVLVDYWYHRFSK